MPSKMGSELIFKGPSSIVGALPNENFITTYQNGSNAYIQVITKNSVFVGNAIPLGQVIKTVTVLPNGKFVVIYQLANGISYAQVIDSSGVLVGSPTQATQMVTLLSNGNFVVAYQNGLSPYIQIIDFNGALVGAAIQGSFQALLSNENFVVLYQSGSNYYAQVVMPNGTLAGNPAQTSTGRSTGTTWPPITVLSNGSFVTVYLNGGNYYGQVVNASGTLVGNPVQTTSLFNTISALSGGNFVLGYTQPSNNYNFVQVFSSSGAWVGGSSITPLFNNFIALANGGFLGIAGSAVQLFSATGGMIGTNPIQTSVNSPVVAVLPNSSNFLIASSVITTGGYSLIWVSATNGNTRSICAITQPPPFPSITVFPNGNFAAICQSSSTYSIQFAANDGTLLGSAIQSTAAPSITVSPSKNVVTVAYTNAANSYVQVVTTNGALVGSAIPLGNSISDAKVLPNGSFMVTYQNGTNNYAQIVSPSGVLIGNSIQSKIVPNLAILPNGNFAVVYQASSNNYYAQLFNSNATMISTPFSVASVAGNMGSALFNDYLVMQWQTPDGNTHFQVFYAGTNLITLNADQDLDYLQDAPEASFQEKPPFILTEYNTVRVTLTLSDPQAGVLTTSTLGNVTLTFDAQQGILEMEGDVDVINALLNATKFIPAPNYESNFTISLNVTDEGNRIVSGALTWIGVPTPPVLINNTVAINATQTVILDNNNFGIHPATRPATFIISNSQGAQFELVSDPGKSISQFTQQQINAKQIQLVSDGKAVVAYQVVVSDGRFTLSPAWANVIFYNNPPVVLKTPSQQVLDVNKPFSFSFFANETFQDPEGGELTYYAQSEGNSPLPNGMYFNTNQSNQLTFSGNIPSPGNYPVSIFARDPLNATEHADFNVLVLPNSNSTNTNTNVNNADLASQIASPLGAAVGTGLLAIAGIATWRHLRNKKSRESHPLAAYVRDALKVGGVDNFYAPQGQEYVNTINALVTELENQNGINVSRMGDDQLKELGTDIAAAVRNIITPATDCWGNTVVTTTNIKNNLSTLVGEVVKARAEPTKSTPSSNALTD